MRTTDCFRTSLGKANVSHISRLYHIHNRTYSFFNRDMGINAGWLVEIYIVHSKTLQRVCQKILYRFWSSVHAAKSSIGRSQCPELYCNKSLLTP